MLDWISTNLVELVVTVVVLAACVAVDRISAPRLLEKADEARFRAGAASSAVRFTRGVAFGIGVLVLAAVWGVGLGTVLVFATTAITLLGVAFFASWSLLSNVTSYLILLVHPSFRRGNFVRVIDADNYVEGYISELGVFNSRLITEHREVVLYPNNLLLARPMVVNPRSRLDGIGKLGKPDIPATGSGAVGTPPQRPA